MRRSYPKGPNRPRLAETPLAGCTVRLKPEHPRGPHLATIRRRYTIAGGYWAHVPALRLETVIRPTDWETVIG